MKVCLLGRRGDQEDEGMKNISINLYRHMRSAVDEVELLDLRTVHRLRFWRRVHQLDPDVVHLVPGPSSKGLALLRLLEKSTGCATIATTTLPPSRFPPRFASRLFQPDRLLAQSSASRRHYDACNLETHFLPLSGVDTTKFSPVSAERKRALRRELGLPLDETVFLHVGHLKPGRDIEHLLSLVDFGELLVVSSPTTSLDSTVGRRLRRRDCRLRIQYCPDIEKYYQSADVYVFPTTNRRNSVQIPLSVLEAMACDVPVIATRFGGLPTLFEDGEGFHYVHTFADRAQVLPYVDGENWWESVRDGALRERVEPYAWKERVRLLVEVYEEVVG